MSKVGNYHEFFSILKNSYQNKIEAVINLYDGRQYMTVKTKITDDDDFGFSYLHVVLDGEKYSSINSYLIDLDGSKDSFDEYSCSLELHSKEGNTKELFSLLNKFKDTPIVDLSIQTLLENIGHQMMANLKSYRKEHLSQKQIMGLYEEAVRDATNSSYDVWVGYTHEDENEDFSGSDDA